MSKAQKKNQKRGNKKQGGDGGGFEVQECVGVAAAKQDPMLELRERLDQAKAEKNHDLANKLRQELWIMQDLSAGYKPKLGVNETDSKELLAKAVDTISSSSSKSVAASSRLPGATASTASSLGVDERKLKTLRKKLDQIQSLKKKQERGVTLEANQLAKMTTEESIKDDIEHLEMLISVPSKR